MSNRKVLIAAGGTGGHIYPAMALAMDLQNKGVDVHFGGGGLNTNQYFNRDQFPYTEISSGFMSTTNPLKFLKGLAQLSRGVMESKTLLKTFSPNLVIGFGSYHTFPVLTAAKLNGVPIVLHEQNAAPGRVNRIFSPYAIFTAISIPDACKDLKGKSIHVEMPIKFKARTQKAEARKYFNLRPDLKTVLIFGGSQGAEVLNQAILRHATQFKEMQIIHFTGEPNVSNYAKKLYREQYIPSCVKDFENRMDLAWSAADMAITRSGANTITEAIEYEVPLIMVPYAQAMDNHQEKNADFMIETVGGGSKILEENILTDKMVHLLRSMPLEKMVNSISEYKKKQNAQELSSLIVDLLGEKVC